jgi:hypothetical protein
VVAGGIGLKLPVTVQLCGEMFADNQSYVALRLDAYHEQPRISLEPQRLRELQIEIIPLSRGLFISGCARAFRALGTIGHLFKKQTND